MPTLKVYDGSNWQYLGGGASSLLVAETVVSGSAATSVTFSGLDGNAAGGYVLELSIVGVNNVVDGSVYLHVNGDTTNTHYAGRYAQLGASYTSSALAVPTIAQTDDGWYPLYSVNIDRIGGYFTAFSQGGFVSGVTSIISNSYIYKSDASITNITSLTITTAVASNLNIGSTFRLYKRK